MQIRPYFSRVAPPSRFMLMTLVTLATLLLFSCLSLKITLRLPEEANQAGILEMEYRLSGALQNISNYPPPREDIAPMPLPLWEWDFRAIAAQSDGIQLLEYSFVPARFSRYSKEGQPLTSNANGVVRVKLHFGSEQDLCLLLGQEIYWRVGKFRWQLSSERLDSPDASYPKLNTGLTQQEKQMIEQFFADQTLEIRVEQGDKLEQQHLSMAYFLLGRQNINLKLIK